MPITKITIKNFKGIGKKAELTLKPITLLFGANSAGKSTIFQALLFLRELLERQNADADRLMASGAAIDLGGFEQFVHKQDPTRKIRLGVEMELDADGLPQYGDRELAYEALADITKVSVDLLVEWSAGEKRPYITHYQVGINGEAFGAIRAEPGFEAKLDILNHNHPLLKLPEDEFEEDEEDPGILAQAFYNVFIYGAMNLDELLSSSEESGITDGQALNIGDRVIPDFGKMLPDDWKSPPSTSEIAEEYKDVLAVLSRVFCGAGELVLNELQKIRYLGPTRVFPSRGFRSQRSPGNARWADGSAAWDLLYGQAGITDWFDEDSLTKLGLGYRFGLKEYFEVPVESRLGAILEGGGDVGELLFDSDPEILARETANLTKKSELKLVSEKSGIEVDPSDVGAGVSQVVPVVVGAMAPGCQIFAVEQPELHIHPAVQCELADVFIREANQNSDRLCLIETHSEHFLLRLMRRIRETHQGEGLSPDLALSPEALAVFFVETEEKQSHYREITIDQRGKLKDEWPCGFFEERLNELF